MTAQFPHPDHDHRGAPKGRPLTTAAQDTEYPPEQTLEQHTEQPSAPPPLSAPNAAAKAKAKSLRADLARMALRQLLPLSLALALGYAMWHRLAEIDLAAVASALDTLEPRQWALALVATAGSFWAVGRYDCVLHRQLGTGYSPAAARRSGIAAIALAQAIGFGALTGALVRWRMLPGMTLWQSIRLSVAVALSFLAGWAVVAAIAVVLFHPTLPWAKTLATVAIGLGLAMALATLWPPRALTRFALPSLRTIAAMIGLAAVDTVLAGAALYVLLPPGIDVAPGLLVASFLFALGAGLVGGTPGGVGPFELTLLSLLETVPPEPLLAGALAFRVVYYAVPAAFAALIVLRGPLPGAKAVGPRLLRPSKTPFLPPRLEAQLYHAPRAEVNLLRQRDFQLLTDHSGAALGLAAPVGQSLVMLSDPMQVRHCPDVARSALETAAAARYLSPAIYKCGARMAAAARAAGWAVLPVSEEAWLAPADYSPEGAPRRQLRRMLRKADDAGLRIEEGGRALPMAQMSAVAADWARARGGERGFSMGTYCPDYVTCQRVFLAWKDAELVAFVTFHETRNEWTLDLMRQSAEAPDGVMHALIDAAIRAAAAQRCPRVSLAAVPWERGGEGPILTRARARFAAGAGAAGLRRFKAAFAPHWEVLYFAAPNRFWLLVSAIDILRRVTAPPRGPQSAKRRAAHRSTSKQHAGQPSDLPTDLPAAAPPQPHAHSS